MNDDCPPFSAIRRLGDLTGDAEPDPKLVAHLENCAGCRDLLDRLMIEGTGTGPSTIAATVEDSEVDSDAPPAIPGLVDFQKIGHGGSAVVYKARREGLDVWVAVKFLDPGPPGSRSRRERAVREAQAAARVRHPNVVRTFDVGLADGSPYIVMEYFEAGTLADRLGKSGALPPSDAARLVLTLAEAVQAIHGRGLIHRDLKPSNVLLHGKADADLANLQPVVADFGLAREIDAEGLTDTRHGPGTPGYMAPEQVEGRPGTVTEAADVFALGAILYRLLTGRPPFAGQSRMETMQLTLAAKAPPISRDAPEVPWALEAIVANCLRRRPAERYPSAAALADDLQRFLEGRRPARRPLRITSRVGALLALIAVATALAVPFWQTPTDLPTPAAPPVISAPVAPPPSQAPSDVQVKERVHSAARLIENLTRTFSTMNGREITVVAEACEGALIEARMASPRLVGDPDFRRDRAQLAGGMARLEDRRGNGAVACRLFAEAADLCGPIADAPWTDEARLRRAVFLLAVARDQIAMRRYDEALAALADERELLRTILNVDEAADLDREARFLTASIQVAEGPTTEGWRTMAVLREEIRAALRDRPRSVRLWHVLGDVYQNEGRLEEALETCRRRLALPTPEGEFGELTVYELAGALIELARRTRDPLRRQTALDEAEPLIRDGLARMERIQASRGDEFAVVDDAGWLRNLASFLNAERERDGAAVVGDRFAERLAAALAAETRDGRAPVDGGRLAALRDELAAEYAWVTRPGAFDPPTPDARRGYEPGVAARDFERGLGLLERGEAPQARLRFAAAFVDVASGRRIQEGDWRRAAELCEQARALVEATPSAGPPADRLFVLSESWSQTVKALWDHAERPRTREALLHSRDAARALFEARSDDLDHRAYDKAIARLANFEREGGDYEKAAAVMAQRRPLWPEGSTKAVEIDDALIVIEDARKAPATRSIATGPGRSPAASP
ncbi:serine/threonine-protein kinase [Paludisphaera rhizosphaerae]|uniref:serine/threonine-protein kinase n=1 Tax=Paludisphaera rhizosphaerae TaxID=2711216 RepID=UPI0013ECEDF6|nr:serine/threonine-protein kinase [Paludisphaera rhizosphaerae]